METKQRTYICKKTYIEQGKAVFIKDKMYTGNGNLIAGECSIVYMDDNAIKKYFEEIKTPKLVESKDNVNHPKHYNTNNPVIKVKCNCGEIVEVTVECIDIIRNMPTWKGNAIKYLWREGLKEDSSMSTIDKEIEDLKKAVWYINDRIKQLNGKEINKKTS